MACFYPHNELLFSHMGMFGKSEDQKKAEAVKKLKEDQEKIKTALEALGLDFDSYSDEEIKEKNKKSIQLVRAGSINNSIADTFVNASLTSYERLALMRQMDIISQNWILIRQNELLLRKLEKL